jgi:hypothetical protein
MSSQDVAAVDVEAHQRPTGVTPVPHRIFSAVKRFISDHGGSADAVIEPLGCIGVRLTLVGKDGVLGDQVVADIATAQAVIDAFPELDAAEWDRALTSAARPRQGHTRKMAGWLTRCACSLHHVLGCRVGRRVPLAATAAPWCSPWWRRWTA